LIAKMLEAGLGCKSHYELREDGFINNIDYMYLKSYAVEHLVDLLDREKFNRYDALMHKQTEITRVGRAKIIDTLFSVAQNLKIDDKSIVY